MLPNNDLAVYQQTVGQLKTLLTSEYQGEHLLVFQKQLTEVSERGLNHNDGKAPFPGSENYCTTTR